MFTGLIEHIGTLRRVTPHGGDTALEIESALPVAELALGESIAVNGVCLTVTAIGAASFSADASHETLRLTSLGALRPGDRVHLERALTLNGRLGGHLVQGHVDGTGRLARREPVGRAWDLRFEVDAALASELVVKGSVTVDGVSLTVNGLDATHFSVTIIPHTESKTLLIDLPVGRRVNIETDIIGKYVRRFLGVDRAGGLDELLTRFGYVAPETR